MHKKKLEHRPSPTELIGRAPEASRPKSKNGSEGGSPEANSRFSELQNELRQLSTEHEALREKATRTELALDAKEREARELSAQLGVSEARLRNLQASSRSLESQLHILRNSVRFRLGDAIVSSRKTVGGMLSLPSTIWKIYNLKRDEKRLIENVIHSSLPQQDNPQTSKPTAPDVRPAFTRSWVVPTDRSHNLLPLREDGWTPSLSKMPRWVEIPTVDCSVLEFSVVVRSKLNANVAPALARVEYIGNDGTLLTPPAEIAKGNAGHYVYLSGSEISDGAFGRTVTALRLTLGTVKVRLGFQAWGDDVVEMSPTLGYSALKPGVTVVIPAYNARSRIKRCLETLAAQSLNRDRFEIVVVLNGPEDGTRDEIERFAANHKTLAIQTLSSDPASAGGARNVGIGSARFDHITLLDDDDELTPQFLEKLVHAGDGSHIVITHMVDVIENEKTPSPLTSHLDRAGATTTISYRQVGNAFSLNAAKLSPTTLLRRFLYNRDLRSGEDVAFWADICTRTDPKVFVLPYDANAHYLRHVRDRSISRMPSSYDFSVTQRLDVIADLDAMHSDVMRSERPFLQQKIDAQAAFIVRYLSDNADQLDRAMRDIAKRALAYPLMRLINGKLSKTLVYSFCFPPYIDPSGIVMAKRIAAFDGSADVVSNNMSTVRQSDLRLLSVASGRLGYLEEVSAPAHFSHWPSIAEYVDTAIKITDRLEAIKGPYREIYSRALWPASHFAAAAKKLREPHIKWTAEFSDPVQKDIHGKDRQGALPAGWLEERGFPAALSALGFDLPLENGIFFWCEVLPIAMADELVFTNANQLAYMASYQATDQLRDAIIAKARIVPQPVMPPEFYEIGKPEYTTDDSVINIGYFGSFYATRGMDVLFSALASSPKAVRDRIHIHVFTQQSKEIEGSDLLSKLSGSVHVNRYVGYLEFLALTRRFDYLLVLDADTRRTHRANPFLPSKLSDYMGSGNPIWALVESGSPMCASELTPGSIKTDMRNKTQIRKAIRDMVTERGLSATC